MTSSAPAVAPPPLDAAALLEAVETAIDNDAAVVVTPEGRLAHAAALQGTPGFGRAARRAIGCERLQWVPTTRGELASRRVSIWCDEDGVENNAHKNQVASRLLGEQVHGGELYGAVLLCLNRPDDEEEDA